MKKRGLVQFLLTIFKLKGKDWLQSDNDQVNKVLQKSVVLDLRLNIGQVKIKRPLTVSDKNPSPEITERKTENLSKDAMKTCVKKFSSVKMIEDEI